MENSRQKKKHDIEIQEMSSPSSGSTLTVGLIYRAAQRRQKRLRI